MAGLADVISGAITGDGGPLAPLELQAAQAQTGTQIAQDPSRWANLGWGGALAHMLAMGQDPGMAQNAVQQITNARTAALPDLAAAYAAPDPAVWAAQNPQADPVARWTVLSQTPLQVAEAKNAMSDATLRRVQAGQLLWQLQNRQNLPSQFGASPAASAAGTSLAPAVPGSPASAAAPGGGLGSGRYGASTTANLPIDPRNVPAAALPAYLQTLNPTQRALAMASIRSNLSGPAPAPVGAQP